MSKNNLKFFDFEVYPEWWCCAVSDEEDNYPGGLYNNQFTKEDEERIKSKMRIYTSDDIDSAANLKEDFMTGVISGYNIKRYDLIIAKCIFSGFSPKNIYLASELIIHPEYANKSPEYARMAQYIKFGWNQAKAWQDLMDDSVKGLKDKECSLGIDIRETTVPFNKINLTPEDIENILFYNKHDVYALHVFYWTVSKAYIDTKIQLCDIYELSHKIGYVNTNANLSGKVLDAERTHNTQVIDPTITIRDIKLDNYFKENIPSEVYNHLLTSQNNRNIIMYNNLVSIGDGGLHSEYYFNKIANSLGAPDIYGLIPDSALFKKIFGKDAEMINGVKRPGTKGTYGKAKPALYVEQTDNYLLYNIDASSCYPSVMIYCQAMSRAIKKPERFKEIYLRRLKLKQTPKSQWTKDDFAFVAAAKLILNTTYGAMGNKYLSLYDDYMRTKVTRVGQMILIALSNKLYNTVPNLKVIQTNTDGVLVYFDKQYKNLVNDIVDNLSEISNFVFEIDEDIKIWQINVNNYIAIDIENKLKNKGNTFVNTIYEKGTNKLRPLGSYCIANAQIAFYTKNENPIQHLLNNTDITQFCLTATKGPTYSNLLQYNSTGVVDLGKVSRAIAVTDINLGILKKRGVIKKTTKNKNEGDLKEDSVPLCPPHPLVVNDALYNYKIEDRKLKHIDGRIWTIDYSYYARELDKALSITWYKLSDNNLSITREFNL